MHTPIEVIDPKDATKRLTLTLATTETSHSFYSEHPDLFLETVNAVRAEVKKHLPEVK